jgi:O-antigen ligase
VVFFSIILSKTYIAHRIKNLYQFELSGKKEQVINGKNIGNPRWIRWQSAMNLIKEKPLLGHGTADEYIMLNEQFKKDGLQYVVDSNYNAHNQFLGYGIRFGILGIIVLLHFFVQNLKQAFQKRDPMVFMVFLSILLICIFENYFDRNFGITFSAIFLTILTFLMVEENPRNKDTINE